MEKIIGEITKTKTSIIRSKLYDFKGETYLDVRVFFKNSANEWAPTRKGISISKKNLAEVINHMEVGEAELNGKVKR